MFSCEHFFNGAAGFKGKASHQILSALGQTRYNSRQDYVFVSTKEETRLNAIVYDTFNLNQEERQLIEDTTKYLYGEV